MPMTWETDEGKKLVDEQLKKNEDEQAAHRERLAPKVQIPVPGAEGSAPDVGAPPPPAAGGLGYDKAVQGATGAHVSPEIAVTTGKGQDQGGKNREKGANR